ncbi:MAG: NAD-dependent succinate-semialdehyde dehydrogenase [Planctomycetota bacterium]
MILENYINGEWQKPQKCTYFEVDNPATLEILAQIPWMYDFSIINTAIESAHASFYKWAKLSVYERANYCEKLRALILENKDEFAKTMTKESGKVIRETESEVYYSCDYISTYIAEAKSLRGETIPSHLQEKRILAIRQPLGVVAAITPWNFPLAMLIRKIIPALLVGCSVVVKPSEETPITAYKLFELIDKIKFPKGVANLVFGEPEHIGKVLCESEKVAKVSFTGSVEVGKILMKNSANTVKKLTLELGGNAPFIVFEDANIDEAVCGLIRCKFRNAGQTCISANRIFLHERIYNDFMDKLISAIKQLKVGNGLDPNNNIGPLINEQAICKVEELINDALRSGAKLVLGGKSLKEKLGGYFFEPTLLVDVTPDMKIWNEEIFGPVVIVRRFDSDKVIELANSTKYGLAAYIFTQNISRAITAAENLEFGIVGVNDSTPSATQAPFGGIKQTGFGREGGKYALEEYTYLKYLSFKI